MPENKKKYTGAWCPSITPFDADGKLDLAALEKHFSRLSEAGTDGVLLMGSIGEFTALSMDERVSLIHAARTMTHLPLIANVSGLACSRRAVHDHHVFGAQHFVDGSFLRGVQPRETHRLEGEMSGLRRAVENVAQFCQAAVPCGAHPVQGFEHQAVGSLVQVELHADAAVFPQMRKGFHVR